MNNEESERIYRLVPVDEKQSPGNEKIDFIEMLQFYQSKRRIVYWCAGVFLAIGIFVAFFSQPEFQTTASIIPEYELQDEVNEIIESYGLIFGLIGSVSNEPKPSDLLALYPHMIGTVSFKQKLMHEPFYYPEVDSMITMYEYFTQIHKPSLLQIIGKYTVELPVTIAQALRNETTLAADTVFSAQDSVIRIIRLTPREKKVANLLEQQIDVTYQRRPGIVRLNTTMPEPVLAAKLAQLTLEVLQKAAQDYKTKKTSIFKKFLTQQLEQANTQLQKNRQALISFKQAESQPIEKRMELQSRYNFALDYYNTISHQVERIKLTLQEQMPALQVLDDITIPAEPSAPNRSLIIILSLLFGFFIAICWITILFLLKTLSSSSPK